MTTRRILSVHPEAVDEARAAREWYADRSESAAVGFQRELDETLHGILDAPERWPRHHHGTRRGALRRFPFLVIHGVTNEEIHVVAVAHGRRRPGYWRER